MYPMSVCTHHIIHWTMAAQGHFQQLFVTTTQNCFEMSEKGLWKQTHYWYSRDTSPRRYNNWHKQTILFLRSFQLILGTRGLDSEDTHYVVSLWPRLMALEAAGTTPEVLNTAFQIRVLLAWDNILRFKKSHMVTCKKHSPTPAHSPCNIENGQPFPTVLGPLEFYIIATHAKQSVKLA